MQVDIQIDEEICTIEEVDYGEVFKYNDQYFMVVQLDPNSIQKVETKLIPCVDINNGNLVHLDGKLPIITIDDARVIN